MTAALATGYLSAERAPNEAHTKKMAKKTSLIFNATTWRKKTTPPDTGIRTKLTAGNQRGTYGLTASDA